MIINVSIKSKRTNILPQNCYPVALLFKDGGGLANHPLSYHPQEGFGCRENERKVKKMREKNSSGKTPAKSLYLQHNEKCPFTGFVLSLYIAQISKNTKIPSIPIIHEGQNWKNHKKEVKRVNWVQNLEAASCEFRNLRKFAGCEIFLTLEIFAVPDFLLFFSSFFF